jgi:methylenetetrahydrofolate--tRNA-(uracil-5-)-methyltransferase
MNINYGLLPPLDAPKVDEAGVKIPLKERGRAKKRLMSLRALEALKAWRDTTPTKPL